MDTIIRNARILTMDDELKEYDRADILIRGTRIIEISSEISIPEGGQEIKIIDASGLLAIPGLVNSHTHSTVNFQKGTLDGMPLELFMLFEAPPLSNYSMSPRFGYVQTMLGNIEMLKLGVTSVIDDAFWIPEPTTELIDGLIQSYADSGMRATVSIDQPMVIEYEKYPFLYELLPESYRQKMASAPLMSKSDLLSLTNHIIEHWHNTFNGRLRAAVNVSAPQRVPVDVFEDLSCISRDLDLAFDVHILETKVQRVLGDKVYGKSFVKYIHDLGLLDERMNLIHAIWIDETDIELISNCGCAVIHNPGCNLRLGSGLMRWRALKDSGIPISLGNDELIAEDNANMWEIGKLAGSLHTLGDPDYRNWPKAAEIFWSLTRSGARAMRRSDSVGVLGPGYEADIVLVDLNTIAFTPLNDIYRQLVYCENGSSVLHVLVAGEVVVEDGEIISVDEEAIKSEARELMKEYSKELTLASQIAEELLPYYHQMYMRAVDYDVGMNRWVGSY